MPTPPEPHALTGLTLFALARLGRLARGAVRAAFDREGMSASAHFALLCLREYGGMSQRELADHLSMDRSDLVKLLDQLEHEGTLRRTPDPSDRRRHVLTITPLGATTVRHGERLVEQATDKVLSGLDTDQRTTLHRLTLRALDEQGP